MHVYHYAPYEPSAFKRLMGRYAVREADMDRMLRANLFVDLHAVVKRSLRASVEEYSIKALEVFYGFRREVALDEARVSQRVMERALELEDRDLVTEKECRAVEGYNRDDCLSALRLRDWLEELRGEVVRSGASLPRPALGEGEPSEKVGEREQRERELAERLLAGIPADPKARTPEDCGRWLLAHLLGWHRREQKVKWWEYYRLRDLTEEELLDEKDAIAGLEIMERVGGTAQCPVDRYRYPFQEVEVRKKKELNLLDGRKFGSVAEIDRAGRTLDVKKRKNSRNLHPTAVFAFELIHTDALEDAIVRIAEDVIEHGIASGMGTHRAARELLLSWPPRLRVGRFEPRTAEMATDFAVRIAPSLDHTVLPIQGPPGSGKTYTGAAMIANLVSRGQRVGVTALSHKVIDNLLKEVIRIGRDKGLSVHCAHRDERESEDVPGIERLHDNEAAWDFVTATRDNVVGGTAHLWARPECQGILNVLVVDEAGQMQLAMSLLLRKPRKAWSCSETLSNSSNRSKEAIPTGRTFPRLSTCLPGVRRCRRIAESFSLRLADSLPTSASSLPSFSTRSV